MNNCYKFSLVWLVHEVEVDQSQLRRLFAERSIEGLLQSFRQIAARCGAGM